MYNYFRLIFTSVSFEIHFFTTPTLDDVRIAKLKVEIGTGKISDAESGKPDFVWVFKVILTTLKLEFLNSDSK